MRFLSDGILMPNFIYLLLHLFRRRLFGGFDGEFEAFFDLALPGKISEDVWPQRYVQRLVVNGFGDKALGHTGRMLKPC